MAKTTKTNNPWVKDWKERFIRKWKYIKSKFTYRKIEIAAIVATTMISFFALIATTKALELSRQANNANDSTTK